MAIDKREIEKYFSVGEIIKTGGERSEFEITKIGDKRILIKRIQTKLSWCNLNYSQLSIIVNNFKEISGSSNKSEVIGQLFVKNKLGNHSGKPHMYGLIKEYLNRQETNLFSSSQIQTEFELAVEKAKQLSSAERLEKLQNAPKKPDKRTTTLVTLKRNEYVVAEVLARANGICAECKKPAPFNRKKDNTPYLEVHHIIRLADDGDDSVENAIALCPNCHRQAHFG